VSDYFVVEIILRQGLNSKERRRVLKKYFLALILCSGLTGPVAVAHGATAGQPVVNALGASSASSVEKKNAGAETQPTAVLESWESRAVNELDFRATDIRAALDILSQKSGVPLDIPEDLQGSVSLGLKAVSLSDVLKIILEPKGLRAERDGARVKIVSQLKLNKEDIAALPTQVRVARLRYADPHRIAQEVSAKMGPQGKVLVDEREPVLYLIDTPEKITAAAEYISKNDFPPLSTEVFVLQYAEGAQVADKISSLLTKGLGTLKYDPNTKNLVVTDTVEKMAEVSQLLARLDRKVEVTFNVAVYRIQLNEEHQNGIDWEAIVSNYQRVDVLGEKEGGAPERNRLSLGTLTEEDYEILLEAVETVGEVTKVREDQVKAVVNQEVEVKVTTVPEGPKSEVLVDTVHKIANAGQDNCFTMPLLVRANLNDHGALVLDLSPRLFWQEDGVPGVADPGEDFSPQEHVTADMGENDVLTLGGFLREREVAQTSKFPLLGDLPLFGFVFRHQNRLIERTEYVVFIVPQIGRGEDVSTEQVSAK